jgi:tagatose-6-phosphate ketose/aldose isomerase
VARLTQLAALAREGQAQWDAPVAALAQRPFNRVIYLGSGPLEALARECALKVLELTAGRVLALANTPLGFRHGPKSTLDGSTLVIVLRSVQPLARRYEQDLLDELRRDGVAGQVLAIGPHSDIGADDDYTLAVPVLEPVLDDPWLAPVWLAFGQLFALQRSAALGLTPDNPFPDGTVNRVVKGVTIHHG